MSLEAVIQENTNALRDLIAQLKSGTAVSAAAVAETVVQSAKATSKAAPAKTDTKADPKPEEAAAEVTIDMVKKATTDLAKAKGRDAAVAVLAKFDAKNANDIPPEQYADYIAAATAAQEA